MALCLELLVTPTLLIPDIWLVEKVHDIFQLNQLLTVHIWDLKMSLDASCKYFKIWNGGVNIVIFNLRCSSINCSGKKSWIFSGEGQTRKMAGANFLDHKLVSVDPSILSCWEEKVKEGFDCTLLLKHSKGKVTTILKCSKLVASSDARNSVPQPAVSPTQAEVAKRKKKRRKMSKKKLESLLSYQERLAREKGLPPSRLMLQHAAVVLPLPASKEFQCDQCEFSSISKRGLSR